MKRPWKQPTPGQAAIVHIHARNPETGQPSSDLSLYRRIVEGIRAENDDVIICITTGGGAGMSVEERLAVVPAFKPELASMNTGSMNWGMFPLANKLKAFQFPWEEKFLESSRDFVFQNTFKSMEAMCRIMDENGTKPELEAYDVGHLHNIAYLLQAGVVKPPITMQFVTGILGGIGSSPYDIITMHQTADRLFGKDRYNWSVIGAGRSRISRCDAGADPGRARARGHGRQPLSEQGQIGEKQCRNGRQDGADHGRTGSGAGDSRGSPEHTEPEERLAPSLRRALETSSEAGIAQPPPSRPT